LHLSRYSILFFEKKQIFIFKKNAMIGLYKKNMQHNFSIRWHSRAGQGAVTAANFLTEALAQMEYQAQSFPDYGAEKRGAPVEVFNRFSRGEKPLRDPAHVGHPDMVVLVDTTLVGAELDYADVLKNIMPEGVLMLNTHKTTPTGFNDRFSGTIWHLDATKIALETIRRNVPNVALVGGITKILDLDFQQMKQALEVHLGQFFSKKIVAQNLEGFARGFGEVRNL
jgi:2-oxoacid:acceptor oxidoreductase gamma subunit (pyruvate/2-ketoisovalerate family)